MKIMGALARAKQKRQLKAASGALAYLYDIPEVKGFLVKLDRVIIGFSPVPTDWKTILEGAARKGAMTTQRPGGYTALGRSYDRFVAGMALSESEEGAGIAVANHRGEVTHATWPKL